MKKQRAQKNLKQLNLFEPQNPVVLTSWVDRWLWAALALVLVFCLLNYSYTDLHLIARHSMNLWDVLFAGKPFTFYQTGTALPVGSMNPQVGEVPYDIWVYLPLAVWNLPVYLWEIVSKQTFETNLLAMIWIRLFAVLPFVGANWAILGIAQQLGRPRQQGRWACFVFSTSLYLLNGTFLLGQIDILGVFFTLMGLWAYLRKDSAKFISWFALAISCKMLALFVFLPLLLLWEKRLWRIAGHTLAAVSLSLASKLLFFADKMATPKQFDERRFIRFLFDYQIELGGTSVSLFVVLFGALLIYSWCSKVQENQHESYALWVFVAGYACFFIGANTFPYWGVLLAPCAPLLLLARPAQAKQTLWLDLAASGAYFAKELFKYGAVYTSVCNTRWMLAGHLNGMREQGLDPYVIFSGLSQGAQKNAEGLVMAVLIAATAALLWIHAPGRSLGKKQEELAVDLGSMWVRFAVCAAAALMPLALYLL